MRKTWLTTKIWWAMRLLWRRSPSTLTTEDRVLSCIPSWALTLPSSITTSLRAAINMVLVSRFMTKILWEANSKRSTRGWRNVTIKRIYPRSCQIISTNRYMAREERKQRNLWWGIRQVLGDSRGLPRQIRSCSWLMKPSSLALGVRHFRSNRVQSFSPNLLSSISCPLQRPSNLCPHRWQDL